MADATNAANNSIPKYEADPKQRCDPRQAASSPPGFYPNGIENQGDSEFEDFAPDASDLAAPASLLPHIPRPGSRLIDQPPERRGFGIMGGR